MIDFNPKYPNKYRSDCILQWLREHTLLSRSALCTRIGMEYSVLDKALDGKQAISAKWLDQFEKEISAYGYVVPDIPAS